ncbi:ABC-type nitrate/sulfonate/bicarbonate transport system permease component [Lipingzhangella halophila]|uniref:ABC-type nitrate/sulfonate/bicarbonate transport system permease component n=1 Tax=Lipingzhangella halophila TaxID=1783352 RepID=A0A7W7RIX9_9ACTN|nr:ABC transporter permease [Lipingzhangella halophila]MBB4932839.1 ABC-type nitrate/sulfonate/bicarbonate transport system permease component [Lipingzhangella halophila]
MPSDRALQVLRRVALRAWLPVLVVAVWWVATWDSDSLYFPSLQHIVEVFARDWLGARIGSDLLPSLGKLLTGFALSAVLGVGLGLLLGMAPMARAAVGPIVLFLRSVPGPVLVPFGILVIGIGPSMNVFIIVMGAVWPTLLNTIDGVRSLDEQLRDMARSYRLTRAQRIRSVILPSAGPQIFAGLRVSLQLSIILVVVSEMVASTNGIGYYVLLSQQTFQVPETWAGTLLLGALGYLASLAFVQVERRVLAWQIGMHATTGKELNG